MRLIFTGFGLTLGLVFGSAANLAAEGFTLADATDELRYLESADPLETVDLHVDGELRRLSFVTDDDGMAVYQGDIVLGKAQDLWDLSEQPGLSLQSLEQDHVDLFGLVARDKRLRWPDGHVPYIIDKSVPSAWIPRIRGAIREWERETDITFSELKKPTGAYVLFFDHPTQESCQTRVGYPGNGPRRVQLAEWCQKGNIAHEIGHVLGLHHEQARFDHDAFIEVHFSDKATKKTRAQFRADPTEFKDAGPYCYDSIMHYGRHGPGGVFRIDPRKNPQGDWVGDPRKIGQRGGLAACDVAIIQRMYGKAPKDVAAAPTSGFEGDLVFFPQGCEEARECYLKNDLTYTDPNALVWKASKRDPNAGPEVKSGMTDGASIPDWAQGIVGPPFDPSYIKAAVIHDHYTYVENRVRSWWDSQAVFHDMLLDEGVSHGKAQIMYLAVLVGSRKWLRLVPGENCGPGCLNEIADSPTAMKSDEQVVYREWPETYGTREYERIMREGVTYLALYGGQMSQGDVDALAAFLLPDHPVFSKADEYSPDGKEDAIFSD